jgi:catechol 2,3-dioxygenase-like lactoylglutathione lyase family enzyme
MFSHITVGTNDIDRAKQFYDKVLAAIGLRCQLDDRVAGWLCYVPEGDSGPEFLICRPIDGGKATFGNGVTIGFNVRERAQVDIFHKAALAAGGVDEGAPGTRPHYHPSYYGAYVRDPDGNKLCCVCHRSDAPGLFP